MFGRWVSVCVRVRVPCAMHFPFPFDRAHSMSALPLLKMINLLACWLVGYFFYIRVFVCVYAGQRWCVQISNVNRTCVAGLMTTSAHTQIASAFTSTPRSFRMRARRCSNIHTHTKCNNNKFDAFKTWGQRARAINTTSNQVVKSKRASEM